MAAWPRPWSCPRAWPIVVPAGVDAAVACMAEPVGCAIHGMDRLVPLSGLPLLIIGGGPAGQVLLALARLTGVGPIVVAEPDAARRAAALAGGADVVLDPADEGWQDAARAVTGGHGFDQVIEAAGSPDGLGVAIGLAARHARILIYGVAHPDAVVGVRPNDIYARELTILGAALNPYTHARAVELVGQLGLERLEPGRYPLERFAEAFEAQQLAAPPQGGHHAQRLTMRWAVTLRPAVTDVTPGACTGRPRAVPHARRPAPASAGDSPR